MNGDDISRQSAAASSAPAEGATPPGRWSYTPGSGSDAPNQPPETPDNKDAKAAKKAAEFEWTGSEFIAHSKSLLWYMAFAAGALVLIVGGYLLVRDVAATVLMAAAAIILGVLANRPPRTLTYRITQHGLHVGRRFYPFGDYKAFSVMDEGAFSSITFWPLKRFGIPLSLYYDPKDEAAIAGILADHLPMQPHVMDPLERLLRGIRF